MSYLTFELVDNPGKTTSRWNVRATRGGAILGTIKWFGRWRGYALHITPDLDEQIVFNHACLREVADFTQEQTRIHLARQRQERLADVRPG